MHYFRGTHFQHPDMAIGHSAGEMVNYVHAPASIYYTYESEKK